MDRTTRLVVVALLLVAAMGAAGAEAVPLVGGFPATLGPVTLPKATQLYRTFDGEGVEQDRTAFRVVSNSGNCCENHLLTTPDGTLLDFGGNYIHVSADEGQTWRRVLPATPVLGGEGTLANAPNGDIIGVGWDPYTGDHLQTFKFDAATKAWLWSEQPLHTPFYDREWVTVVPGPITVAGTEYPYITVLRGGYPTKDVYLVSTDGLTYTVPSGHMLGALNRSDTQVLSPQVSAHSDYGQTMTHSNLAPLGARALMSGGEIASNIWGATVRTCTTGAFIARADLQWACHEPAETEGVQWNAVDSSGRLHATQWSPTGTVAYVTSVDGGRTVEVIDVPLPEGYEVLTPSARDLKANATAGTVAIALHARHMATGKSQDFLFVYSYADGESPVLDRWYRIGLGDLATGSNVSSTGPRFDFASVAILPDGRVATSFDDSKHRSPAVAIELPTEQP